MELMIDLGMAMGMMELIKVKGDVQDLFHKFHGEGVPFVVVVFVIMPISGLRPSSSIIIKGI